MRSVVIEGCTKKRRIIVVVMVRLHMAILLPLRIIAQIAKLIPTMNKGIVNTDVLLFELHYCS